MWLADSDDEANSIISCNSAAVHQILSVSRSPPSGLMRLLFGSIACYSLRSVWASCPGSWLAVTGPVSTATGGPRPRGSRVCVAVMERFNNNSRTLRQQMHREVRCVSTALHTAQIETESMMEAAFQFSFCCKAALKHNRVINQIRSITVIDQL